VLRLVAYRDADWIATLYTRGHGKVSALARGARSSRRRFGAALGHLAVSRFGLERRRGELWTLTSAELRHDFTALAADLGSYAHASYVIELLRELAPPEVAEPALLDLVIALHHSLVAHGPRPAVLRAFELHLLHAIGSAPVLDRCVACGRDDDLAEGAWFDPSRGGVLCRACGALGRGPGLRPLPGPARAYLLAARSVEALADARDLDAGAEAGDPAAARDAVIGMITHLLGHPLRTLEFLAKVRK
jgi:DNA repair protein RecO (recombination protein O)